MERGHTVYMDILPPIPGLSSSTSFKFLLWLVDRTSRYAFITGLPDCTTESVIDGINKFTAPTSHPVLIEFDIQKIKADAGSQFTSAAFQQACADSRIAVSLAAPKHQEQNHFAERSWQSVKILTDKIMVHARLPPIFKYHATLYAIIIYNVTPIKNLVNKEGNPATPYEIFFNEKPRIAHLRVFGCPCVFRKWTITNHLGQQRENKTSQRGVRGTFIGLPINQQGYLIYMPQSQNIAVSHDVSFDEAFQSAIITNWKPFQDALSLRPEKSCTHTADDILEHTGDATNFPSIFEEGNYNPQEDKNDNLSDVSSQESYTEDQGYTGPLDDSESQTISEIADQDIVSSEQSQTRASSRIRKRTPRFEEDPSTYKPTMRQHDIKNKKALMKAYKVEVIHSSLPENETIEGTDPSIFFPPPASIHQTIRIKDEVAKNGWFKAVRKEVTQLVKSGTFDITVKPNPGEAVIDIMETNKIKLNKDGMLDKLKSHLCVRGDIQKKKCPDMEDSHSPAAAFRYAKILSSSCCS